MTTLKQIPYDFKVAKFSGAEGGWSVEIITKDGKNWGSGTHKDSLEMAYSAAEIDLEAKLRREIEETQEYFWMGTWLG